MRLLSLVVILLSKKSPKVLGRLTFFIATVGTGLMKKDIFLRTMKEIRNYREIYWVSIFYRRYFGSSAIETNYTIHFQVSQLSDKRACDNTQMFVRPSSDKHKKKLCCVFCLKLVSKLARHLEIMHKKEPEVKKFVKLPKGKLLLMISNAVWIVNSLSEVRNKEVKT